jgi:uncharacterized YccA/Bax inhibitor family protein
MFGTANPALSTFEKPQTWGDLDRAEQQLKTMSIGGTVTATSILLGICAATAVIAWNQFMPMIEAGNIGGIVPWTIGGAIGGLVFAMIVSFAKRTSPFLAPVYAAFEGVFLAGFSAIIPIMYFGQTNDAGQTVMPEGATMMIFQAIGLTFGILFALRAAYAAGLIRIGGVAAKVMVVALGGLVVYSFAIVLLNMVFNVGIPNLWASNSPIGIGFSAIVVILASLFLVLDFQFIEAGVKNQAPKYMEWYGAFGLLVTLVWLYLELLRLLAKLRNN